MEENYEKDLKVMIRYLIDNGVEIDISDNSMHQSNANTGQLGLKLPKPSRLFLTKYMDSETIFEETKTMYDRLVTYLLVEDNAKNNETIALIEKIINE